MMIARFTFVGLFNTVLTYCFYLLLLKLGFHYQIALSADYLLGIVIGYSLNRYWTFKVKGEIKKQFFKYLLIYILTFLLNAFLLFILVEGDYLGPELGQFSILLFITLISYVLQKNWVFLSRFNK